MEACEPHYESVHQAVGLTLAAPQVETTGSPGLAKAIAESTELAKWEKPLTVAQYARILQMSGTTIRRWIKTGRIEAKQVTEGSKKRWMIPREMLPRHMHTQ